MSSHAKNKIKNSYSPWLFWVFFLMQGALLVLFVFNSFAYDREDDTQLSFLPSPPTKETMEILVPFDIEADQLNLFTTNDRELLILKNMYEPLVDFDENLRIQPRLATSWGIVSPTLWELTLRENVMFENGKTMDSDDVIFSFNRMKQLGTKEIQQIFGTVQEMQKISSHVIRITTKEEDPLFLNKLRYLFIIPSDIEEEQMKSFLTAKLGSGAYVWKSQEKNIITLQKNETYYKQDDVLFKQVQFILEPRKFARLDYIREGKVSLILGLPDSFTTLAQRSHYTTVNMPTLESIFILFNFNTKLSDPAMRHKIIYSVNYKELKNFLGRLGRVSSQFTSSGVFGYNPDILLPSAEIANEEPFKEKMFFSLKTEKGNESLATFLAKNMEKMNIKGEVITEDDTTLLQDIASGKGDIFIIGWKFGDGDVSDFYNTVVHSKSKDYGIYNGLAYDFSDLNEKIDQSNKEMDVKTRLKLLQGIMKKIVEEYTIGVPLLESQTIYGIAPDIYFTPSMDGSVTYRNFQIL